MWTTPKIFRELKYQKKRNQKTQEFENQGSLLREEERSRPIAPVRTADMPRAELDPAADEDHVWRTVEANIGNRIVKFITR